ncbi:MAG: DUF479 domain-containing protein [Candidatus Marinimicrobia bacterium]|nr:DUF479 domain-containing protein [Candidatus Neomarinimicrobiota bacterium]
MNYLAHLLLSPNDELSRLGNIMGDFMRGIDPETLPPEVWSGILLHRSIDAYTDSHRVVRSLREGFSSDRRRFSGVVLDVVFDHFLVKHWSQFSERGFNSFVDECYADLWGQRVLMPERMEMVIGWMIKRDWIRSYSEIDHVGRALDGLASRLKINHDFHGAIEEVNEHYDKIEAGFLAFFPELVRHVERLKDGNNQIKSNSE